MAKETAGSIAVLLVGASLVMAQDQTSASVPPPSGASAGFAFDQATTDRIASQPEAVDPANRNALPRLQLCPEYLFWWVKNGSVPAPLVTTGALTDQRPGAATMPETVVRFGDSGIDYRAHSGGRLTGDLWLDDERTFAIEGVGFVTETHTVHFGLDSNKAGSPVIARPFLNTMTGEPDAQVITAPATFLGGIDAFSDSRLWGSEGNVVIGVYRGEAFRADLLAGFRYLVLDENIRISQSSTLLANGRAGFFGSPVPPTDIISINDFLGTSNEFYGGQVGARGEYRSGRWNIDFVTKVAVGATHETYRVVGSTKETNSARVTLTGSGGLYALSSNSGMTDRSRFSFAPEIGVGVGFQVTPRVGVHLGYSVLWWDAVARPGDEVNPRIDPRQVPSSVLYQPTLVPAPSNRVEGQSNYWAQGLSCGLEFDF